jgi:hypothetical protein
VQTVRVRLPQSLTGEPERMHALARGVLDRTHFHTVSGSLVASGGARVARQLRFNVLNEPDRRFRR